MRDEDYKSKKCCDQPMGGPCREMTSREWLLKIIEDRENELVELRRLADAMPNMMDDFAERGMRRIISMAFHGAR